MLSGETRWSATACASPWARRVGLSCVVPFGQLVVGYQQSQRCVKREAFHSHCAPGTLVSCLQYRPTQGFSGFSTVVD